MFVKFLVLTCIFILPGPEEDLPRKLDVMEFVMHAPSDYYKANTCPYPLIDTEVNNYSGYIWTSLEPKERTQTNTNTSSNTS